MRPARAPLGCRCAASPAGQFGLRGDPLRIRGPGLDGDPLRARRQRPVAVDDHAPLVDGAVHLVGRDRHVAASDATGREAGLMVIVDPLERLLVSLAGADPDRLLRS
jgi:hypothetical protein